MTVLMDRPRSDLRLSELARHLVIPDGIVETDWPIVARQLSRMGITVDRWQQNLLTVLVGKRADGQYACGIGGAVMSIPRQTGKTYSVGALAFALCLAHPNLLVLWSAHRAKTHNETFRSMCSLAESGGVRPFVHRTLTGANSEAVEFANGSRILFGARENGFGRGFAKVDVLVLDEAQILSERAMEDMVPATNAAPNGLVVLMGTPPRPVDPGEVFTHLRESALSGEDKDVLYVEFSADEGANPNDKRQWSKANPSFPKRTSEQAILRMRKLLGSVESFKREALGIWDKRAVGAKAFKRSRWEELVATPADGVRSFGVKFSPDGSHVALAGAVKNDDGVHVEGIRQATMGEGTQWLVDFLVERARDVAQIVVDGKSGVGYLVNALRAEGVGKSVIVTPALDQVVAAHAMFERAVVEGNLTHSGQPELDGQALDAVRRKIGNAGGFGWDHPVEGETVVLLDAVTLAFWGARTSKRVPGRRQAFL